MLWDHRVGYDWFCLKQVGSGNKEKYIHLSEQWGPHSLSPLTMPRVLFFSPMHHPAVQCKPVYNLHPNQNYFNGRTQVLACFDLYSYEVLSLGLTSAMIIDKYLHRRVVKYPAFSKGLKHVPPWWRVWPFVAPWPTWILAPVSLPHSCLARGRNPCTSLPCFPLQTSWPPNYFAYLQPRSWTHLFPVSISTPTPHIYLRAWPDFSAFIYCGMKWLTFEKSTW